MKATYEAGPTGYGLARGLLGTGVECLVAAPGKIPRGATERVAEMRELRKDRFSESFARSVGEAKPK